MMGKRNSTIRKFAKRAAATLAAAALACTSAHAEGLRTKEPAVLYSGLSEKSPPLAILETGYPLLSISRINQWEKVETPEKLVGWIRAEHLEPAEVCVVAADSAEVRAQPQPDAAVEFVAEAGVILEVVESAPGEWLQVRHEDGEAGYVLKAQVWRNSRDNP